MNSKLFNRLCENILFVTAAKLVAILLPGFNRLKKYKNILSAPYSIYHGKLKIKNNPIRVRIAPINICNYLCLFCEIHKDNLMFPNREKNEMTLDDVKNYESFLSTTLKVSWVGGTAEPLLNKNFGSIVEYLKSKYGTIMMTNTNGSRLDRKLCDILIKYGFDSLLISYHAGTKDGYKKLMTGNIDIVDKNLIYLKEQKALHRKNKPAVQLNFALQRLNAVECRTIIDKVKQLDADELLVSKYYGGRNQLQDQKVSFDYDINEGNRVLDDIYSYAKDRNVKLCPAKPDYWTDKKTQWDHENYDSSMHCKRPWTCLHFKPVLNERNCHYVGVCNRTELFKISYDKLKLGTQQQFELLWNHPLLQYLRETVNSKDSINPVCKYCKNYSREIIRNTDAQMYADVRDRAIKDFFGYFHKNYPFVEVDGIEVLKEHPHSDEIFQEKKAKADVSLKN
ncbi:MAG: radical SAM protein [Sedimentisphaerales bacterium]|nr:radical SAM protein [Sedimentisphaerales bacterium]